MGCFISVAGAHRGFGCGGTLCECPGWVERLRYLLVREETRMSSDVRILVVTDSQPVREFVVQILTDWEGVVPH